MNQKTLILAACIVAGATAVYFLPKAAKSTGQPAASEPVAAGPEAQAPAPVPEAPPDRTLGPAREEVTPHLVATNATTAPASAWVRLAEKYGAEKTALSGKITSNLTSVISEGIELANTAVRNSGSGSIAEAASKEVLRTTASRLALTEEQQQQAAALIQSTVAKRISAVTDLTSAMSTEPEQIMEVLLAGDALARKEISQEEYDRITQPTRTMLQNLAGFVAGRSGSGGAAQFLGDAETTAQLNTILTPEQQTKLAEMTASRAQRAQSRQASRNNSGMPFQGGQIPIMELDRMDRSVAGVKQMAEAARLMMEAMKGIKDANAGSGTR